MKNYLFRLTAVLILLSSAALHADAQIPLILPPWYSYEPLSIQTRDYSDELLDLTKDNAAKLAVELNDRKDEVSIESLFIFSVRLYDLGMKDEAVYWYHTAKIRASIFSKMLDPEFMGGIGAPAFELKQGFVGFVQLAGQYINGYAGGDIDKWVETLRTVQQEVNGLTNFDQYPEIRFLPMDSLEEIKAGRIQEYEVLIDYLETNKKDIRKKRKQNGIEGRY